MTRSLSTVPSALCTRRVLPTASGACRRMPLTAGMGPKPVKKAGKRSGLVAIRNATSGVQGRLRSAETVSRMGAILAAGGAVRPRPGRPAGLNSGLDGCAEGGSVIPGWILLLVSVGYVGLLFGVAWLGDRKPLYPRRNWLRPIIYSLALAVYCSSWTFYGAVGTAATTGLGFLPIYLGPILLFLFGWRILERMVLVAREQSTVSIADFLAARYGRAQNIAATVTLIAVIAAIPYIALQFKAVAMSIEVLSGVDSDVGVGVLADPALYSALLLALFAILFGTREIDATEHHHGMILAVALESLVKLVAFVAVGVFALGHLPGSEDLLARFQAATRDFVAPGIPQGFVAQTLLAFAAIVCLPRQFHVAVVECQDPNDVRAARWMFGGYLVLFSLLVVPITLAGQAVLAGTGVSPDTYVLALPLALNQDTLALVVYVGGFSAATGMVIVSSVALATMVSNDLVMPVLLRTKALRDGHSF